MNQLWLELATPTPGGSTRHLHRMKEVSKTYRPLETLKLWENNPRTISEENFERLKRQIKKLGEYKPLVITPDGTVLGGNMRLRAYRELGFKKAWVSVVHPKSEEEKIEYALSDNDRVGEYQEDELANLIGNYPNLDLETFAVDLGKAVPLSDLQVQEIIEDEPPEVEEGETVSELGEVYQLGRHRLMCGDATKKEDVERLMNGEMAEMVFTDPPYGVSYGDKNSFLNAIDKGNHIQENIDNDTLTVKEMKGLWVSAFQNMNVFTKAGGSYYCCSPQGGELMMMMMISLLEADWELKQTIIWVKNNHVLGRSDYHYKHEPLLYGWKSGARHKFYGSAGETTVWNYDKPLKNELHPTQKPIELISHAVGNSSKKGELVLDLFGGSGSTLIACEQLKRVCYMMELDPKYCDVIRKRYAKFIGKEEQWQKITPTV